MPKSIVHLDADAFFASVEQAADPRLRGKPVAVGGEKRGIIASASYEARRFGVFTPMPTARARKLCPRLLVLPGNFEKYERFSRWMFSYAYDFTPHVEQTSIDEGYFDLSGARKRPTDIELSVRAAIGQTLKITVSEGLGTSKLVSQIASKLKKPAAFHEVPAGGEITFLHPLPTHWLPGIGPHMPFGTRRGHSCRLKGAHAPADRNARVPARLAAAIRSHGALQKYSELGCLGGRLVLYCRCQ